MSRRPTLFAAALIVAGCGLAVAALASHRTLCAAQGAALRELARSGLPANELRTRLGRAASPAEAGRRLARALVADALGARHPAAADARLATARTLAAAAWRDEPASWEAAMLHGAAGWLAALGARDPRLYRERSPWEAPLRAAKALAPAHPEPRRLLASALLDVWFALSRGERQEAREALREALRDPATFEHLHLAWLRAEPDTAEAFALVPDQPWAWEKLQEVFARERRWDAFREAHVHGGRALSRSLEEKLAQARARLADGDARGARQAFLEVAVRARPGADLAALAEALRACPPGPVDLHSAPHLRRTLDWALERSLDGPPPLEPALLLRLSGQVGELPRETAALAALAAGDLAQAESHERRAAPLDREAWSPYLLLKARFLAEHGNPAAAWATLIAVHPTAERSPRYWETRRRLAAVLGREEERATAEHRLGELAGPLWEGTDWRWRGSRPELQLFLPRRRGALRVALDVAPAEGAVVEFFWDGLSAGTFVGRAGESLAIPPPRTAPGVHTLTMEVLAGARVVPGAVAVADS